MHNIIIIILAFVMFTITSADIKDTITKYFNSATTRKYASDWQKFRNSFQSAIAKGLQEDFEEESRPLNILIKDPLKSSVVTAGLYFRDNAAQILLGNLTLKSPTYMLMPEVQFNLASNVLRLGAGLTVLHLTADYIVRRAEDSEPDQNPYKHSPFTFPQVAGSGKVTIIGSGCNLVGNAFVYVQGTNVRVGQDNFAVNDCTFTIELYSDGMPPVIAPYFTKVQGQRIMRLLSKPIRQSLLPKLTGTILSYVNTTDVFGKNIVKYGDSLGKVLKACQRDLLQEINQMNERAVQYNNTSVKLPDFSYKIKETFSGATQYGSALVMDDVTLYGLETVYSGLNGGPIKSPVQVNSYKLLHELRFHRLVVYGNFKIFPSPLQLATEKFSAEISDVAVSVLRHVSTQRSTRRSAKVKNAEIKRTKHQTKQSKTRAAKPKNRVKSINKTMDQSHYRSKKAPRSLFKQRTRQGSGGPTDQFEFHGWRKVEFSMDPLQETVFEDFYAISNSLITAYLDEVIPAVVIKYLSQAYSKKGKFNENIFINTNLNNVQDESLDESNDENYESVPTSGETLTSVSGSDEGSENYNGAPSGSDSNKIQPSASDSDNNGAPSGSGSDKLQFSGSDSTNNGAPSGSDSGEIQLSASGSKTDGAPSGSGSDNIQLSASGSESNGAPSGSGSDKIQLSASGSENNGAPSGSGSDKIQLSASGSENNGAPSGSGSDNIQLSASGSESNGAPSGSGSDKIQLSASGSESNGAPSGSGSDKIQLSASGSENNG